MIDVKYDDGHFYVSVPFHLNHLIQDLPERKFIPKHTCWRIPANWRCKEALGQLLKMGSNWTKEATEAYRAIERPRPAAMADERILANYPFVFPPFDHQKECYLKAFNQDAFAIFFEQGLGKTKTTIDLCGLWHGVGAIDTVVVICPVSIMSVWEKEFEVHYPFPYELQLMKGVSRWKSEGELRVLVCGVESLSQGGTYDKLSKLLPTLGRVALVVDESSRIKNHKALRTTRVVELATMCTKRLILTGTPVTQGIQDLYSQFQALNPSTLALTSFYAFRNRYCILEEIRGAPRGAVKIVGYQYTDELLRLIEPWSLRKTKEDCLDLPPKTFQTRLVNMAPSQSKAYKELKKNLWTEIIKECGSKEKIEVEMVLEAYMRLQQLTGGHYPVVWMEEGPDGKPRKRSRAEPLPGTNPKLQELLELLSEIPSKVIVWTRFRSELAQISEALTKAGRKVVEFHGGLDKEQKKASIRDFQEGDADAFVATYAAAYGLTLTAAHTAIYFSMDFGLENFLQSQDRIHRIGQSLPCTYILLACSGSVDEDIVEVLTNKKSLADVVSDRLKNGDLDSLD